MGDDQEPGDPAGVRKGLKGRTFDAVTRGSMFNLTAQWVST